ncbi:MAG: FHA domain-containing protein, partial [Planctomycetota bacterium]
MGIQMLANVREALHELLSLLEAPSEAAPGTFNGFVRVGKHELGLEVQLAEGNLVLRAFPEDVLTARLKAHPSVAAGLGTFTDLVRARLFEYAGRLALEVKLAGIPPGRFRPVLRGVTIDCARLRGAAEGLVAAAAKNALIASPITKTKLRLPPPGAASPASNVTRSRLGMLDELQQAVGKDSAPLKKGFVNRGARLTVEHGPGEGLQFVINERASYTIGRSSDADLTIRDHSISRKNSLLAWEDDRLYIEDLNSANGTRVNNISVSRSEIEDGDLFEVGESTLRVER